MMKSALTHALAATASLGMALIVVPSKADATCGDPATDGEERSTTVTTGGGMATSLNPSIPHPTLGKTLIAENDTIHVMDTATLVEDDTEAPGDPIENTPNVVELDDGSFAAFVAHDNGDVSRINPGDADDGISASTDWTVSTGRGACSADSMTATPVVHLRRFATSSFKAAYSTDLIYVATRYGCDSSGGRTDNIIRALDAETGATVWTFNGSATVDLDDTHEAPFIDIDEDRLIVATDRTNSTTQHSLWSIDVLTGTKSWSVNAGLIYTTPVMRDSRIYIATLYGEIKAINKSTGATIWTKSNGFIPYTTNFFVEFRPPYDDLIGAVDFNGDVRLYRDDGSSGALVWTASLEDPGVVSPSVVDASSRVAIDPSNGKVFVGAEDGQIYQLNITDGSIEATREVDPGLTATVGDAAFLFSGSDLELMAGTSDGDLMRLCSPWAAESPSPKIITTPPQGEAGPNEGIAIAHAAPNPGACADDSDCGTGPNQCSDWSCQLGTCVAAPKPDGTGCDDGNDNTNGDSCLSGTCYGLSTCDRAFDRCSCTDDAGKTFSPRQLLTLQPSSCPDPTPPGVPQGFEDIWCGTEVSLVTAQSACLSHGTRSRTAYWISLFDTERKPFDIDPNLGDVTFEILGGDGTEPVFLDPDTFDPLSSPVVSLSGGNVVASADHVGVYYVYFESLSSGNATDAEPFTIAVTTFYSDNTGDTCSMDAQVPLEAPLRVNDNNGTGGPCKFSSDIDSTGYLEVIVTNAAGDQLTNAPVRVGYANDKFFAKDFDEAITNTPSAPNQQNTGSNGKAIFEDFGNYMNGPIDVFATCPGGDIGDGDTASVFAELSVIKIQLDSSCP